MNYFAVCPPYNYSSDNMTNQSRAESLLIAEILSGRRPNLDVIPLPQLLKDLIKRCWDADPSKRPTANDLVKTLNAWRKEINNREDTEFTRQVQTIEEEYNKTFKDKEYPQVNLFSKPISTGSISSGLSSRFSSKNFFEYYSKELDFDIEISKLGQEAKDLTETTKRQLSLETQTKTIQGEAKLPKITESEYHSEPMEIDYSNWQNIHLDFTDELIQSWQNLNFTYQQVQDWINAGFQPADYNLVNFVKNILGYEAETVLNNSHLGLDSLRKAYERYLQQGQQKAQIIQTNPPKNN